MTDVSLLEEMVQRHHESKQHFGPEFLVQGIDLLQQGYLGSSGTRGYGWVEVKELTIG